MIDLPTPSQPLATVGDDAERVMFHTRNSTYLFTWIPGQQQGVLTCMTGTFPGVSKVMPVEPFHYVRVGVPVTVMEGSQILFRSTPVVSMGVER